MVSRLVPINIGWHTPNQAETGDCTFKNNTFLFGYGKSGTRGRLETLILQNLKATVGNQIFGDQMCCDFSSHCCVFKIAVLSMMIFAEEPV